MTVKIFLLSPLVLVLSAPLLAQETQEPIAAPVPATAPTTAPIAVPTSAPQVAPTKAPAPKPTAAKPVVSKSVTNFTSPDRSFSVWLPGKPAIEKSEDKDKELGVTIKTQSVTAETSSLVYSIIHSDFAPMDLSKLPQAMLLGEHEKEFVKGLGGKVVSRREVKWLGRNAREVVVDSGQARFQLRFAVVKSRLYQSFVGGLKSELPKNRATNEKFFNSLTILK